MLVSGIVRAALEAFFNAFGTALLSYFEKTRAEQTLRDLGAAQANNRTAQDTIASQQAQLEAQANAPHGVDDAIARLEAGSA